MCSYRAYLIGKTDHVVAPAIDFDSADDATAIVHAQRLRSGDDIELWQGTRRIGRVTHQAA